jgi:flagellar hook-length control protein FliK
MASPLPNPAPAQAARLPGPLPSPATADPVGDAEFAALMSGIIVGATPTDGALPDGTASVIDDSGESAEHSGGSSSSLPAAVTAGAVGGVSNAPVTAPVAAAGSPVPPSQTGAMTEDRQVGKHGSVTALPAPWIAKLRAADERVAADNTVAPQTVAHAVTSIMSGKARLDKAATAAPTDQTSAPAKVATLVSEPLTASSTAKADPPVGMNGPGAPQASVPLSFTTPVAAASSGTLATMPDALPSNDAAAGGLTDAITVTQLRVAADTQWVQQIARDLTQLAGGEGRLQFRLNPDHLGQVSIDLAQGTGGASVLMIAETPEARDILSDARPQLVADARANGLALREAQVTVREAAPSAQAGDSNTQQSSTQAQTDARGGQRQPQSAQPQQHRRDSNSMAETPANRPETGDRFA